VVKENTAELLRLVLPPALTEVLDLGRLVPLPLNLHDDDLNSRYADLIFKAPLRRDEDKDGDEVWVAFLLEHLSKPNQAIGKRLDDYVWLVRAAHREQHPGDAVPEVVPLVVFNSREQRSWGPTDPDPDPRLAGAAGSVLLRGRFALLDLPDFNAEKLRGPSAAPGAQAALLALKVIPGNRQIHIDLAPWMDLLARVMETPRGKQEINWMARYSGFVSETPVEQVRALFASLSPDLDVGTHR
jgi:hypothetical protein